MASKPAFPAWWHWELSFTPHAELRMEQRGVTEVDVRAMLERATAFEPSGCRHRVRGCRMTERSLQVTYRKGKPFSAYLHLSHQTGEKSARTVPSADGLLVVDHGQNGKAIGVEITAPSAVPLDRLNRLLSDLGKTPLSEHDYLPVRAA